MTRPPVRLSDQEVAAIRAAAAAAFGDDVVIHLFGSRTNLEKRGGDIDLHFEVAPGTQIDRAGDRFEDMLFARIDPQRVDKVFTKRGTAPSPFAQIALRDGIRL